VSHRNNRLREPQRKEGWGLTFGGGYDFSLNKNLAITPFVTYSFSEADDQEHNALTLGDGFTLP
jgi:outer membrane autotransporter protein